MPGTTTLPDDSDEQVGPAAGGARRQGTFVAVAALLVALGAVGGLLAGTRLAPSAATPAEGSADAGFARDMRVHHLQAVEMGVLVREATEDAEVRQLALDIVLTQQQQAGQMHAWLETWGLPQSGPAEPMAWMTGHGDHGAAPDGLMPGMATRDELTALAEADGAEAERIFLGLMIPHHEAGVEMAEAAVDMAEQDVVRDLAGAIVTAQEAELTVLREMLDARGGAPTEG